MVDIRPFKATILNPEMQIEKLVCPVYDTIDGADYQKYAREKNNIIHVTTRRKDMKRDEFIVHARREFDRFISSKILVDRDKPALYIYGIMYSLKPEILALLPEKERRNLYFVFGLVCLVRVEELGEGNIVGHENIFEVNTRERYSLMKACMMNFSPITAEYTMPDHELNNLFEEYLGFKRPQYIPDPEKPPVVDVTLKCSRHLLWELKDESLIRRITEMVSELKLLVLDGHHRYTAANLMREKDGIEYTMMMLLEGGDRALLLLPWHRTVKNFSRKELDNKINENFSTDWQDDENGEEFYSQLRKRSGEFDIKLGMYDGKKFSILRANEKAVQRLFEKRKESVGLDLMVLHEWLINPIIKKPEEDVSFNASPSEAIARVDSKEFDVAFLLNPISIKDVERKAFTEHKNFPQKSTLFLPKVAEGIVMRRIE
ncbi:MAG: DUF1015 family protein [Candidatus Methanoperedens sp.]|nr:DUF1015 family protein [Candidatus Methanoperedens sp.]MCZ7394264.1 DUF1015 family protein [Candidatus Methanoperedens sp.]